MKAVAVIVGMVLTIAIYIGFVMVSGGFALGASGSTDVPENIPLFIFSLILLPAVLLFLGSISTGIIIEPEMEYQSYPALIFYSPGFYFNLFFGMLWIASIFAGSLSDFVTGRHPPESAKGSVWWLGCFIFLIIPAVLLFWHAASWAGTALGYKIRAKISGDD